MSLETEIEATSAGILARIDALIATGGIKDLTLAAKALEAVRGSATLQALLSQGQASLAAISSALTAAQDDLQDDKNGYSTELTNLKNALAIELNGLSDAIQAAYLDAANGIGVPRVGDIFMSILPDPDSLPLNVTICDGRYIPLADATQLINAWGLNVGGTIVPFVNNYNSGVDSGSQIIVDGTGLRLPNFVNHFFKAGNTANIGIYQEDAIANHAHPVTPNIVTNPAAGNGVNPTGSGSFKLATAASTDNQTGGASETRPKNFSALALVRYC